MSNALLPVDGFALYGPTAASHRVRLSQYGHGLRAHGCELVLHSLLTEAYLTRRFAGRRVSLWSLLLAYLQRLLVLIRVPRSSLAIVYAELFPLLPAWFERWLLRAPYILDLDDAFYLKYRSGRLAWLSHVLGGKIDHLMRGAAAITAGSRHLAAYARQFNPRVVLLPSVVDTDHYRPRPPASGSSSATPFTIGWIGSPSTAPYLDLLVEPLQQLAREIPLRLLVIGGAAPAMDRVEVIEHPWSLEQEVPLLQQFDVGVMPLPDTPWTRGKCAYKLIQCMACAVPVVSSPVGANVDVVTPDCGILAATSADWLSALRRLAADPSLRQRLGIAARERVEAHYSLHQALPVLAEVIRRVHERQPLGSLTAD